MRKNKIELKLGKVTYETDPIKAAEAKKKFGETMAAIIVEYLRNKVANGELEDKDNSSPLITD